MDQFTTVYADTREFYRSIEPDLGTAAFGFKILYGPPLQRPPVLFIGYQPGGRTPEPGERDGWPTRIDYACQPWPLARGLRRVYSAEELDCCVGLNAIFIRSPSVAEYEKLSS
jgi:hypothetical protein